MQLRLQRTEDIRAQAQHLAAGGSPQRLAVTEDASVLGTAWASFVPFLAHPVMAATARAGMEVLERTTGADPVKQSMVA